METSSQLAQMGIEVDLIEKESHLGGHLSNWDRLFPNRRDSKEVFEYLEKGMNDGISLHLNAEIEAARRLRAEGHRVVKRGKRYFVEGYEEALARL